MKKYAFLLLLGLTGCVVDFEDHTADQQSSDAFNRPAMGTAYAAQPSAYAAAQQAYAPQPAYWQNPEVYYEAQPDGWEYAPALTYVQQPSGDPTLRYQPVVVAQPIAEPAYDPPPMILQHPSTRRLVRCGATDAGCAQSYEQQGYVPLSRAPYVAGAQETASPSDYPDASWRDNNNVPRW